MAATEPRTILAYGDSLTWGADPSSDGRHPQDGRWPDVLATELGEGTSVIAEGLCGRTTAYDDDTGDCDRNGARLLPTLLATHVPVDLLILMLGTNDMKPHVAGTAIAATQGMRRLVQIATSHISNRTAANRMQILVVAPPPIVRTDDAEAAAMFAGGVEHSRQLADLYRALAHQNGCGFFDAGTVAQASPVDGVHLDAENTAAIGRALAPVVRSMLEARLTPIKEA
ncbi:SGNH/GDSL hydrolase family protein [Roseitalea porphyridii]|uniref:Arylesterase n=1 Tax=Roseitalea porphyridii TaxID=1852022 RepID=A0A4P6V0S0_9HYPH|nr:SGNH/GDSL hydrolase family protein [Roseitalea porphyridii]QBK30695.1 arylesterase [Roseitalea porphyridii]